MNKNKKYKKIEKEISFQRPNAFDSLINFENNFNIHMVYIYINSFVMIL